MLTSVFCRISQWAHPMVFAFGQVVISLLLLFSGLLGLALARVELAKGCALTMHLGPFFLRKRS
jgi:hypothetical protein